MEFSEFLESVKKQSGLSERGLQFLESQAETWKELGRLVLPYETEGRTYIYGIANREDKSRALATELDAAIGVTFSRFSGLREEVPDDSDFHKLLLKISNAFAFRLEITSEAKYLKHAKLAINGLVELWRQKPNLDPLEITSPRELRRRFEIALLIEERGEAETILKKLNLTRSLSATNRMFLQIQLYANFRDWSRMLNDPSLPDVLGVPRPISVSESLLRGVYHEYLDSLIGEDPKPAQEVLREQIAVPYQSLFQSFATMRSDEALRVWGLYALETKDFEFLDRLVSIEEITEETKKLLGSWKTCIDVSPEEEETEADTAPSPSPTAPAAPALENRLQDLLEQKELKSYEFMEAVALHDRIKTEDSRESVLLLLERFPEEDQVRFKSDPAVCEALGIVEEESSIDYSNSPRTWVEVIQEISAGLSANSVERLLNQPGEWQLPTQPESDPEKLSEAVEDASIDHIDQLSPFVPRLLDWLTKVPAHLQKQYVPVYAALFESFKLLESKSDGDFRAIILLTESMLPHGLDDEQYRKTIDSIHKFFEGNLSDSRIEVLLDLIEVLLGEPCPDTELLYPFLDQAGTHFSIRRKASAPLEQLIHFHSICKDLDQEERFELFELSIERETADGEVGEDPFLKLKGKKLGIYTLTESAANQAKSRLKKILGRDVEIDINNDKSGSDKLYAIAQKADFMVMVTASAQHAATGVIEQVRKDRNIIRVNSRGVSGIMKELRTHLESLEPAAT